LSDDRSDEQPPGDVDGSRKDPTAEDLLGHPELHPVVHRVLSATLERALAAEDSLLRGQAESLNQRKRLEREQERRVQLANEELIVQMLPALDNLRLCLEQATGVTTDPLVLGLRATMDELQGALISAGVEFIEAESGTAFDASIHEAVVQDRSSQLPANTVTRMLQVGVLYHDRVVRPVRVAVAMG